MRIHVLYFAYFRERIGLEEEWIELSEPADIKQAMDVCDRVYCFQEGRVPLHGKPGELSHDAVKTAYFGLG